MSFIFAKIKDEEGRNSVNVNLVFNIKLKSNIEKLIINEWSGNQIAKVHIFGFNIVKNHFIKNI